MVGGLVEQQQVGLAHQHLGQLQAAALAARERVDRAGQVGLGEADVGGEALHARLELVATFALVALLELAVAGQVRLAGGAEARLDPHHLVVELLQRGERLEQGVEERARRRPAPATGAGRPRWPARAPYVARVGLELARQEPQGRGFAGPVRPEERQPVAGTNHERRARKDLVAGVGEAGVGELREGHGCGKNLLLGRGGCQSHWRAGQLVIELPPGSCRKRRKR